MDRAGLRWAQLRALLVLRARLMVRMFAAERGRLVMLMLTLVMVLPLALGLGVGTAIGYLRLPAPWPAQLLGIVLVALWLAWILIPLVAFSLNEGMDITRLLVYPLSRRELIATMLLGTLFDPPTYLVLPLFLAIVVGWVLSPALLVLPLALLFAYVHMVLTSQIVVIALGSVLASRRVRDVFLVLGALLGSTCYLLQRAFVALVERFVGPMEIESIRLLPALRWFPTGSQAQAIASAAGGDWAGALPWLGYGLVWALALAWIWWQLSLRLITGGGFLLEGVGRREEQKEQAQTKRHVTPGARRWRWLPADLQQIVVKELLLTWRTPQRRVGLLQGLLLPVIMVGYSLIGGGLPESLPPWPGLLLPAFGIFTAWIAGMNTLGMEEKGLPFLLLTPVSRRRLWLGKSLANFLMTVAPGLVLGIVLLFLLPTWQSLVGLLALPGFVMATLAVNNLGSIFFAAPVQTDTRRVRTGTRGGCIAGIGTGVVIPTVIGLVALPPGLMLAAAQLLQWSWLGFLGALFTLVYGAALLWGLGVVYAARLLLPREAELLAATRPPQTV